MHDGVKPDEQRRSRVLRGGPTRRSTKGQWTPEEDEILGEAVQRFNGKSWKKIAECLNDRTDVQCFHRWQKVLNPELVKGPWSKEEDEIIIDLVNKMGPKKWSTIAQHLPGRIGKQCRERWHNHLNPGIKKEAWTQEEELALIRAHQIYGNKWVKLTKFLPGRTDNAIKNHWNSSLKKKVDSYLASGLLSQFPPDLGLPNINSGNQSDQILPTTCSSSDTFVVEDSREEERGGVNDDEESCYYEKDPSGSQTFNNEVACSMPSDLKDICQFIEHEIGASSAIDDAMELMLQEWSSIGASSAKMEFSGTAEEYYSPLGIRQMMRGSSVSGLLSPSPTFSCTTTPSISILKKRDRDLLSPLSEKRSQKKFIRQDFSRLVDDTENNEEATRSSPFRSIQDKENLNPEFVYRFGVSPPLKRSLESPSAWKSPSPCFINSFLSSPPRVVVDTLETERRMLDFSEECGGTPCTTCSISSPSSYLFKQCTSYLQSVPSAVKYVC